MRQTSWEFFCLAELLVPADDRGRRRPSRASRTSVSHCLEEYPNDVACLCTDSSAEERLSATPAPTDGAVSAFDTSRIRRSATVAGSAEVDTSAGMIDSDLRICVGGNH